MHPSKSCITLVLLCALGSCLGDNVDIFYYPAAEPASCSSHPYTIPLSKNASFPFLGVAPEQSEESPSACYTKHCYVKPLGFGRDDSSEILAAVERCGSNGVITLPAPYVYTIARRMHMKLDHARLEVFGTLSFEPDLQYWIDNSFRIEFQNQSTSWIVEGHNIEIDGGGWAQGGVNGNGQAWMTRAQGRSNQFGRPIPLTIFNSTNVTVRDFSFRQPQFWTMYTQDVEGLELTGIFINGTNTDPAGNSSNFETNIDGFNSVRVNNARFADWYFHGGDDCIALKGNSTSFDIRNVTCVGGGIVVGSIGQYVESPDYVANVTAQNISVAQDVRPLTGGAGVSGGAYLKSWVGVEAGRPPQGGGGGTGRVQNVTVSDMTVHNVTNAIFVNKCYFKVPSQAQFCDTSTLEFTNLSFSRISGTVSGNTGVSLNCSAAAPCQRINLQDINLTSAANGSGVRLRCVNAEDVSGAACNTTLT